MTVKKILVVCKQQVRYNGKSYIAGDSVEMDEVTAITLGNLGAVLLDKPVENSSVDAGSANGNLDAALAKNLELTGKLDDANKTIDKLSAELETEKETVAQLVSERLNMGKTIEELNAKLAESQPAPVEPKQKPGKK